MEARRRRLRSAFEVLEQRVIESIEELRVFVCVVDVGSIAGAGKVLRLPPVTVGRRLAALEERLGRRLINRSTRSRAPSDAGREFLPYARQIISAVDRAESFLEAERGELDGQVRMGVVSALAPTVVAAVRPVLKAHPRLRIQIKVVDRVVNLSQAGMDVLFMGGTLPDSANVARRLAEVVPVLAASKEYLDLAGRPAHPDDIVAHQTIVYVREPPTTEWQLVAPDGSSCTVPMTARLEIDASTTMAAALTAGLGIGMITRRFVRTTPGMEEVLPGYTAGTSSLYALFPHRETRSRRVEVVIDAVAAAITQQISDGDAPPTS